MPMAYDGLSSVIGGMNASVAPSLVPDGQAANIINGTCRGGFLGNRLAFVSQPLAFDTNDSMMAFTGGNFQGAGYYACPGDVPRIFASVAGVLYRMTAQITGGFYVETFMPDNDPGNNPDLDRVYFCQSDNWLVVQDGQSPAYLVQQNVVRRANIAIGEMPIGTIMAYGFGRTWLCNGPNNYLASDLYGESEDAVILFTDNHYLAENASFTLPAKFGPVMAMAFIDQQDTATGQGPLMVFGSNGAESVNVSLPRTSWQTSQIQVEALTNFGALGSRSMINVNGDLFYRSFDGWRSYRQARGQQGLWGHLPMSTGVRPYTDSELPAQLAFGSAIYLNNRLIGTCTPRKCGLYTVHEGVLSLDFDPLSTTTGTASAAPAWDGFWIPPRPVAQLIAGGFDSQTRAFAFTTELTFSSSGAIATVTNGISEIVEGQRFDDTGTPIVTTLETRAFTCGGAFQQKRLSDIQLFQTDRWGATEIAAAYRQDDNPTWQPLSVARSEEDTPTSIVIDGAMLTDAPPLFTSDNRTYRAPFSGNAANTRLNELFYDIQFQIVSTGSQQIKKIRIRAETLQEDQRSGLTP